MGSRRWILAALVVVFALSWISCARTGSTEKKPMKPYPVIEISDGEYLHYGSYSGGDKDADFYFVTRKETDASGKVLYQTFFDMVGMGKEAQHEKDYRQWPMRMVINPSTGSVMVSEASLKNTDKEGNVAEFGQSGMTYWLYQYHPAEGVVDYISRKTENNKTSQSTYKVKFDPKFPSGDAIYHMFFSPRYLDASSGGMVYLIMPDFLKEPLGMTLKTLSEEALTTPAGSFKVKRVMSTMADPFIEKLMGDIMKQYVYSVEESDRKLMVRLQTFVGDIKLEEIGNVNSGIAAPGGK